jgi:hypothetical protein
MKQVNVPGKYLSNLWDNDRCTVAELKKVW